MLIIRIVLVMALTITVMHLGLLSGAIAQDAIEVATVRGHLADGNAIWRADDFGWFYYDLDENSGEKNC